MNLKGIPNKLKSPKAYERIEKAIGRIMYSDHKHRKISAFMKCKRCKPKVEKRRAYIKEQGFKDYEQYLHWKQVMEVMIKFKEHAKETKKGT